MLIIIMIIHLFPGAFQDMRGRLAKQSGKRDTQYVYGIIDLEGLESEVGPSHCFASHK